jgi:hypothetical protein
MKQKLSLLDKTKINILKIAKKVIKSHRNNMICLAVWNVSRQEIPSDLDLIPQLFEQAQFEITQYIEGKLSPYEGLLSKFLWQETGRWCSDKRSVRLRWIKAMIKAIKTQTEVQPDWG